ncbi:hypothetical protein [Nonomuraea insulae]|uniref:Secreted protein n=1 Tax=Nonomuraea insulae TaxID=1616787 RepID=A0ABW1CV70_9ACTN
MLKRARAALAAGAATLAVITAGGATTAHADTNSSSQKSTQVLCNVVLLSPGANVGDCHNVQISNQNMVKTGTSNVSLVDYFGTTLFMPIV